VLSTSTRRLGAVGISDCVHTVQGVSVYTISIVGMISFHLHEPDRRHTMHAFWFPQVTQCCGPTP
jgi:hypothetical protein